MLQLMKNQGLLTREFLPGKKRSHGQTKTAERSTHHHRQPEYHESMDGTTALPQDSRERYQCVILFKISISSGMYAQ